MSRSTSVIAAALLVLATSKSNDKKAVSLSFLGQGKRPVRVGYIQEAPIWKTSSATITKVGGAMLENRSPGTPTIEPG